MSNEQMSQFPALINQSIYGISSRQNLLIDFKNDKELFIFGTTELKMTEGKTVNMNMALRVCRKYNSVNTPT